MPQLKVRRFESKLRAENCLLEACIIRKCIISIASVVHVLQTSDARRLVGTFNIKDHSSNAICSSHKAFDVVRTSSERPKQPLEVHCYTDWFEKLHYFQE